MLHRQDSLLANNIVEDIFLTQANKKQLYLFKININT